MDIKHNVFEKKIGKNFVSLCFFCLSLSQTCLFCKKLITLNERINPLLTGNNPAPIPGCHATVKTVAHIVVVI
jgi:hypothetical protein